tara:strand:+ start:21254 stop:21523 length:270 start_codon:yes stop_codon:yes gene_type:complete
MELTNKPNQERQNMTDDKDLYIGQAVLVEDHTDPKNIKLVEGTVSRYEKTSTGEGWVIRIGGSDILPTVIRSHRDKIYRFKNIGQTIQK